jgi:hypothetical protein
VVFQYWVLEYRLLDEMRVEVGVVAKVGMHGPLWEPLCAKVHVGFRDGTSSRSPDCWIITTVLLVEPLKLYCLLCSAYCGVRRL